MTNSSLIFKGLPDKEPFETGEQTVLLIGKLLRFSLAKEIKFRVRCATRIGTFRLNAKRNAQVEFFDSEAKIKFIDSIKAELNARANLFIKRLDYNLIWLDLHPSIRMELRNSKRKNDKILNSFCFIH